MKSCEKRKTIKHRTSQAEWFRNQHETQNYWGDPTWVLQTNKKAPGCHTHTRPFIESGTHISNPKRFGCCLLFAPAPAVLEAFQSPGLVAERSNPKTTPKFPAQLQKLIQNWPEGDGWTGYPHAVWFPLLKKQKPKRRSPRVGHMMENKAQEEQRRFMLTSHFWEIPH